MIKLYESFDEIMQRVNELSSMDMSQINDEYSDFKNKDLNDFKHVRTGLNTEVAILLQNTELIKLKNILLEEKHNG